MNDTLIAKFYVKGTVAALASISKVAKQFPREIACHLLKADKEIHFTPWQCLEYDYDDQVENE